MTSLDELERAKEKDTIGRIKRGEVKQGSVLSLRDVSVTLGDGRAIVKETQVEVEPGERLLVAGG